MLRRKALPVGTLFMILVLALATLGVGYGLWSKLLVIHGNIETGKVDAVFNPAFTDDDGKVDDILKDEGDLGPCKAFGLSSCDPKAFGPNPTRYDKDVGKCYAVVDEKGILKVTVENGYPSYHCTLWFDILNNGTIPVKIQSLTLKPDNFTNGKEVTVALSELVCGYQIDPQKSVQGDVHIHVEQDAGMGKTYTFAADLLLVQWNEFEPCGQ